MKKNEPQKAREIIEDLFNEINENKELSKGNLATIFFRDDKISKKKRQVYKVPVVFLKFRKNNGRISSDVLSYEQKYGEIIESTDFGQDILRSFLLEKDTDKGLELMNTLSERGQDEPAVATADGFLINGNRRKMAFEILAEKDPRFRLMDVVILPGARKSEEDELPPTNYEIEQIESAYQFQTHGKSEYTNFDKAISIRRKLQSGMSIEEQLSYDGSFKSLPKAEQNKRIREIKNSFLKPLECVDLYLDRLGRAGQYNTIATAKGSKKGQWQAFIDYYNYIHKYLEDDLKYAELGILKTERGTVQEVAFKLIRARELKGLDKKSHEVMRLLPKILNNPKAKNEIFELKKIKNSEKEAESSDPKDAEIKDLNWTQKNGAEITDHLRRSYNLYLDVKESTTPIDLLKSSLDKLNHDNMVIHAIKDDKLSEAVLLATQIIDKATSLARDINKRIKK